MISLAVLFLISGIGAMLAATAFVMFVFAPPLAEEEKTVIEFSSPRFDSKQLERMSELVIVGKVVKQGPGPDDGPIPQTKNVVEIERVLRGDYKDRTISVMTPESNNDKVIVVDDGFKLKQGERLRLMLFEWKGYYQISGLEKGIQLLPQLQQRERQEIQDNSMQEQQKSVHEQEKPNVVQPQHQLQQEQRREEKRQQQLEDRLNKTQIDRELRNLLRIVV